MTTKSKTLCVSVLCILLASACGDDSGPTDAVTLTGSWVGSFAGNVVQGDGSAMLTQEDANVTGTWSAPMPASLVALGVPAALPLTGPVTGTVDGETAELTFTLAPELLALVQSPDCGLVVSVSSFTATMLEATWTTNTSCPAPINDMGRLTMTRQ